MHVPPCLLRAGINEVYITTAQFSSFLTKAFNSIQFPFSVALTVFLHILGMLYLHFLSTQYILVFPLNTYFNYNELLRNLLFFHMFGCFPFIFLFIVAWVQFDQRIYVFNYSEWLRFVIQRRQTLVVCTCKHLWSTTRLEVVSDKHFLFLQRTWV